MTRNRSTKSCTAEAGELAHVPIMLTSAPIPPTMSSCSTAAARATSAAVTILNPSTTSCQEAEVGLLLSNAHSILVAVIYDMKSQISVPTPHPLDAD